MKKQAVNTFIPYSENEEKANYIAYLVSKWRSKNTPDEKSGSFNVDLYLDYLTVINDYTTK